MFTWQSTSQGIAISKDGKIVLVQTFDPNGNPNLPIPEGKKKEIAQKLIEGMQPVEVLASPHEKALKLREINERYDEAIAALTAGYPKSEIDTWEVQRNEVLAWQANPQATTPWIDTASATRGVPREVYLQRTLAKTLAFSQASAYFTGLRQKYEDQVKQSVTADQLKEVRIVYG